MRPKERGLSLVRRTNQRDLPPGRVSGDPDPETGMICNLADLDSFAERELMPRFAFSNLNELENFRNQVPTTENLSRELFHLFRDRFQQAKVEKVRIEETMMNSFQYAGGRELGAE